MEISPRRLEIEGPQKFELQLSEQSLSPNCVITDKDPIFQCSKRTMNEKWNFYVSTISILMFVFLILGKSKIDPIYLSEHYSLSTQHILEYKA